MTLKSIFVATSPAEDPIVTDVSFSKDGITQEPVSAKQII
jgi:hypothetical protein